VCFERLAMNDVVVNRGATSGMVELRVEVDGHFVANQRADGLIIAIAHGLHRLFAVGRRAAVAPGHCRLGAWCRLRRTPCPTGRIVLARRARDRASRW